MEPSRGPLGAEASSSSEPGGHICKAHLENYENYDVFLSHRGPDTKSGVVRDLHAAFKRAGLRAFMDCESIEIGQPSWECIEDALRKSPIAVVILSKNFAQSPWCLKELRLIRSSPHIKMIPTFYKVKSWEVQLPADFHLREGFEELSKSSNSDIDLWRADLVAARQVVGHVYNGGKASGETRHDLVTKIVAEVCKMSDRSAPLHMGSCFGVVQHAGKIIQRLGSNMKMLGLWGSGGIGKTTLGKELYNQLCKQAQYTATYFAEDVSEKIYVGGIAAVQTTILQNLCNSESTILVDKSKGKSVLKGRLKDKKILLVLDDVVDSVMLEDLISHDMLSEGSLCIVTSRNKAVLSSDNQSNYIHEVLPLGPEDSKKTLVSHVFGGDYPASIGKLEPRFGNLLVEIAKACLGIPLALVVIGRHLKECGEPDLKIWNEVLELLKKDQGIMGFEGIYKSLVISYDSLDHTQQEMFLDVACALLGQDVDYAQRVWKAQGKLLVRAGVVILKNKALITINEKGRFGMHDHLRDLGRAIVVKQYEKDGMWRRMCMPHSRDHWMKHKSFPTSVETLEVIWRERDDWDSILDLSCMTKLQILVWNGFTPIFLTIPASLRMLLCSSEKPGDYSFMNPPPKDSMLIVFKFCWPIFIYVWLKVVLRGDEPWCISSEKCVIGAEILRCKKLEVLDLRGHGYYWPVRLAEELGSLKNLSVIRLERFDGLEKLPKSIEQLDKLEYLGLYWCGDLSGRSASAISNIVSLQKLEIEGFDDLESLPDSFGNLINLVELTLTYSSFWKLPASFGKLTNLQKLDLSWNSRLELPNDSFTQLTSLREFHGGLCNTWIFGPGHCDSRCVKEIPGNLGGKYFEGLKAEFGEDTDDGEDFDDSDDADHGRDTDDGKDFDDSDDADHSEDGEYVEGELPSFNLKRLKQSHS